MRMRFRDMQDGQWFRDSRGYLFVKLHKFNELNAIDITGSSAKFHELEELEITDPPVNASEINVKITEIKGIKDKLRQQFDPEKLVKLYYLIDELYMAYLKTRTL